MYELTALSPWAKVNTEIISGLSPRLDDLNGKTIGLFGDFMVLSVYMLETLKKELSRRYPGTRFSSFQYTVETTYILNDSKTYPAFKQWIDGVDCVFAFYGSVPSSSLFLGYNCAHMEKLGKPTAMVVVPRTYPAGIRGVKAMGVPGVRVFAYDIVAVDKINGHITQQQVDDAMAPDLQKLTDQLVGAVLNPLTPEEVNPPVPEQVYANSTYTGTHQEISRLFYRNGWTNGQPIEIPTRQAVDEMLRGTDLPADHVVGYIPPKMGCATVESIAINAVMAGCLPTYMPVLIAAVQGALDPRIYLEGWTCSQSTWGPTVVVSGPVVDDINLNVDDNFLSPYYKANACIGRAFGYIMMNIGGLRPGIEDLSEFGHEFRLGFVLGDNFRENPWGPVHQDFGFAREDNAVTMFWPQNHNVLAGHSIPDFLTELCKITPYGWDPGAMIIFSPLCAKMFAQAGWNKKMIMNYMVEYARRPASEVDLQWLSGNSHLPASVLLPTNMEHSTRTFWSTDHMLALVGGGKAGMLMTVYGGGGDHGGPSCTRIQLPKAWKQLVEEYKDIKPDFIEY